MRFDADELKESLEVPEIQLEGRTYRGRVLSFMEYVAFEDELRAAAAGKLDSYQLSWLIRRYCAKVFGPPWWMFWKPSVGKVLLRQPTIVQVEAMRNFFGCQARTMPGREEALDSAAPPPESSSPDLSGSTDGPHSAMDTGPPGME